jgi:tight adherence protein B
MMTTTTAAFDKQIPLFVRNLEVALRSGYSVKQAFEIIAKDMPAPASNEAQWVVDEWNGGKKFMQVFENWLTRTPSRDLDLLVAAIRVQLEVEGNLADILQLLAQIMEKRTLAVSD